MAVTHHDHNHRTHHGHHSTQHDDSSHEGAGRYRDRSHRREPGHRSHEHSGHAELFRRLFWRNLVLAVPVVIASTMVQDWLGYHLDVAGADLIAPVLGTVVFLYGGRPFLIGGLAELRRRQPGMMSLIAVAITVAFGASMASSFGIGKLDFWWELAALVVVMLLGHWLEMRAIGQASGALAALAELLPDTAERVVGDHLETVATSDLVPGDVLLVRPGGRVPADGVIVEGAANLDESMLTGESRPARRRRGDRVVAGGISTDSAIRIRVEAVGEETALAGIGRLVAEAQRSRSRAQALADRAAAALFYVAASTALLTFALWALVGSPRTGVVAAITVLVIACPHALGLAIPLVIAISTSVSARAGILIKDRLALERMRTVDTVLFDKTGTLTKGNHAVIGTVAVEGFDAAELLRLAAAVEVNSEHPIARAITTAGGAGGPLPPVTGFQALTGRGVTGMVEGRLVAVGGPALLAEHHTTEPAELADITAGWRARGNAVLHVAIDGRVVGAVTVADELRPEGRAAVRSLRERGIEVVLITGDARQVADAVARELEIDEVLAEVRPEDKDAAVVALQAKGRRVAMVGDGVNDGPALARADVGIAIGAGTDVALESAGVILASDDPRTVLDVIDLSRATYRKMVQNLAWATAYNVLSLPVAAGAFAFAGLTIPPAIAAVAMSLSTIIVAGNAQLLRRTPLGQLR